MRCELSSFTKALAAASLAAVVATACSPQEMWQIVESIEWSDPHTPPEEEGRHAWGEVEFLASGELAVDGEPFSVTEGTEIIGGIYACETDDGAAPNGYGTVECDQESLEATLQEGTVVIASVSGDQDGNARTITEFGGTVTGEVQYRDQEARDLGPRDLSEHEYSVAGTQFSVDQATEIIGGIYACETDDGAAPNGYGTVECDQESLEATLQEGRIVHAEVVMGSDRVAESVIEHEAGSS